MGTGSDYLETEEKQESEHTNPERKASYYTNQMKMRSLIKGVYDTQKLRIATGNRLVASLKASDFVNTKATDADDEAETAKVLQIAMADYTRITDYYVEKMQCKGMIQKTIDKLGPDLAILKTRLDYDLATTYKGLCQLEEQQAKIVAREVKELPIWDKFFEGVKGCGPLMAAICVAYLDVYKARHCSSFWKYAGLDTVWDPNKGRMVGRSRGQTELRDYVDSEGNIKQKRSLTYSPFLKSKLCGVLGGAFLKKPGSKYGAIYYDYKNRIQQRANNMTVVTTEGAEGTASSASPELTKNHIHRMAIRYAVKMFLRDLWVEWRTLEGLPVSAPYEVEFLGHAPHKDPNLGGVFENMDLEGHTTENMEIGNN